MGPVYDKFPLAFQDEMDQVVGADRRAVSMARHGDGMAESIDGQLLVLIDGDIDGEGCFHGSPF